MDADLKAALESHAAHLDHLQKRIDLLQGCLDGIAPLVVAILAHMPPDNSDLFRRSLRMWMKQYADVRDKKSSFYSEFPFLGSDFPPGG